MSNQELVTKTLNEVVPKEIAFLPKLSVCSILGVSPPTLDRYRNDLLEEAIPGFEWVFYGTAYDRFSAECLWQYAQLIKLMRRQRAKELIKKHMEAFKNGDK